MFIKIFYLTFKFANARKNINKHMIQVLKSLGILNNKNYILMKI